MGNRAAEQHLLRVKRGLVCGRADRDYLFARFRQLADGFQEELPEAGYAEFVAAFGRPEDCAAELLSALGESSVESARKKRRTIRRSILAILIVTLVSVSAFWYLKYAQGSLLNENTIIVHGPVIEMTEEEFHQFINPVLEPINPKGE